MAVDDKADNVVTPDEIEISFLEYRESSKSSSRTRIPAAQQPSKYALAIDQEGERAFWTQKGGVAYLELSKLACIKDEIAEASIIPCQGPPEAVFVRGKFLVIATADATVQIHLLSDPALRVAEITECRRVTCSADYLLGADDEDGSRLTCYKLADAAVVRSVGQCYQFFVASEHSPYAWGIDVRERKLEEFDPASLKVRRSLPIPSALQFEDEGGVTMHIINENSLGLGHRSDLFVVQLVGGGATDGARRWSQVSGVARGSGEGRLEFLSICGWSKEDLETLLIVADSTSTEVVCGGVGGDGEFHPFFLSSEEGLIELPMSASGEDTYPAAMALDYTGAELVAPTCPEDPMLPPQPILWVVSSEGRIQTFRIVKGNQSTPHPAIKHKIKPDAPPLPTKLLTARAASPLPVEEASRSTKYEETAEREEEYEELADVETRGETSLFPELSVLTEDLGHFENALALEFARLHEAFETDLSQVRGLAEVLTSRILKGRERIASLHATSVKMAQLGIGLDQQLQRLPQQEDRLCRLLRDASKGHADAAALTQGRDFTEELEDMLERVSLTIERAESLTEEATSLASGADRRRFVREKVLPPLEEALQQMNPCLRMIQSGGSRGAAAAAAPPSGGSLQNSPHWARLHAVLRARSSHAVISTDGRRAEMLKERERLEITCRSIPAPLTLPSVELRPPKPTKLPQTGVLSKAPESTRLPSTTVATGKPVERPVPSSSESGASVLAPKPGLKQQPPPSASGVKLSPPASSLPASKVVQGVKSPPPAATPGLFSFKFTTDTTNVPQTQLATQPPIAAEPSSPPLGASAVAGESRESQGSLSPTSSAGVIETVRDKQQQQGKPGEARSEEGTETRIPAPAPQSPTKVIEELDVRSLEVSSPTPKGPKSPPPPKETSSTATVPLASSESANAEKSLAGRLATGALSETSTTTDLGDLGALSLGSSGGAKGGGEVTTKIVPQTEMLPEEKQKPKEEATVPGLFKVPQSVTLIAASAPPINDSPQQPFAISTSAFGFRPSTLEKVVAPQAAASPFGGGGTGSESSSIFATPLSSPMPAAPVTSTFGSLQSLGTAPQQAPAFGAPSAFGALGGSLQVVASSPLASATTTTAAGTAADRPVDAPQQRPIFGQGSAFGAFSAPTQSASLGAGFSAFSAGSGFSAFAASAAPSLNASIFGAPSSSAAPTSGGGDDGKKTEGKLSFTQFRA